MNEIIKRLSDIDVDKRIEEAKKELKIKKNVRDIDKIVREIKILQNLKMEKLNPSGAFTLSSIPVVPAQYRAPIELPDGNIFTPDINLLLRDIGFANATLKKTKDLKDPETINKAEFNLYKSVNELTGLDNPKDNRMVKKNIFGTISGTGSPKGGLFQRKLTRKRQNLSGRAVISPNPSIDVDEIEVPYGMGFKIYEPYMKQKLKDRGYSYEDIENEIKKNSDLAKETLRDIGKERPLLLNRAPSIWGGSVTGHYPIFTDNKNITIPNLVTISQKADFDGDALSVHVPVSAEAVNDVKRMMPSKNIVDEETKKLRLHPDHAAVTGLYILSKTEEGRKKINSILPTEYKIKKPINKDDIKNIIYDLGIGEKYNAGKIANELRILGDSYAYETGHTIGLSDIAPLEGIQHKLFYKLNKNINSLPQDQRTQEKLLSIYKDIIDDADKSMEDYFNITNNPLGDMLLSKSRGSKSQIRDIMISPLAVSGGTISEIPIKHSYSQGLTPAEYWNAARGARKGVIGRAIDTALPGALGKEILATSNTLVINSIDNDNMKSIELPLNNPDDILDRFIGEDIKDSSDNLIISKGTIVTPHVIQKVKNLGLMTIPVYTPLGSSAEDGGLPAKAYGVTLKGKLPEIGDPVGTRAATGIVEPLYGGSMSSFHTGAALEDDETELKGYPRLKQLFELTSSTAVGKQLPNQATLAKIDGIVSNIEKDELGGHNVIINNIKHYVLPSNKLKVNLKDKVSKGDIISTGPAQPKEIAELKSLSAAQNYMVEEIRKNVPSLRRRSVEVLVEGLTRHGKIIDAGDTDYLPGDIDLINNIEKKNKDVDNKATYEYLFRGVNTLPQFTQSWLSKLNFRNLKSTMSKDIGEGAIADIHSYEPAPALAYGLEYGKGEKGKF
jgi:DNA-directed RNA polymerase subunit beta'